MPFQSLELLFAVTTSYAGRGELSLIGRLEAWGVFGSNGRLELFERYWGQDDATRNSCRVSEIEVPIADLERLVDRIRSVWSGDEQPRFERGEDFDSLWHGIELIVNLDGSDRLLRINPANTIKGPDAAAIKAMCNELAQIAGLAKPASGFPRQLLE